MNELEFRIKWRNLRKKFGVPIWATGWDPVNHRWTYEPTFRKVANPPEKEELEKPVVQVKIDRKTWDALRRMRDGY